MLVLVAGIFLASDPATYRRGLLLLVPARAEATAALALDDAARGLKGWMIGQAVSSLVVAALTWAGLALLGVPAAVLISNLSFGLFFELPARFSTIYALSDLDRAKAISEGSEQTSLTATGAAHFNERYVKGIQAVTPEQVQRVARRFEIAAGDEGGRGAAARPR